MRRLMTFILGMVVGGILLYGALSYHFIRADDGLHVIPKSSATLVSTYVDIRKFTVADLANNADIVEAIMRANKQELLKDTATGAVQNGIDRFLDRDSGQ